MERKIDALLGNSPSYQQLDKGGRTELAQAMSKVTRFLTENGGSPARQLAEFIPLRPGAPPPAPQPALPAQPPAPDSTPPQPAAGGSSGAVGRVGEVARATLNAIDFPSFVASLIQGTFQAIVDSSIKQMEAYAALLKNAAGTIDRFMSDNITDGSARDYLADEYGNVFSRDTSTNQPKLLVRRKTATNEELPGFFQDLGFTSPADIDDDSVEQVIVPAARRFLAESRQRTLATMVLMGINRVVVDDGEINAKLQFHIDATEATQLRFDQTKTTAGNMSGTAGRSPFGAQAVMVNTASLNAQSDINVRADLTGQVRVKFRSETFPLERFADSAAIQLINSHARVPQQQTPPGQAPPAAAPATIPANVAAPAQVMPPASPRTPAPSAPAPATQGLGADDAWAPEV
jgi:hypothetical protein